jgi:hypothetical protein
VAGDDVRGGEDLDLHGRVLAAAFLLLPYIAAAQAQAPPPRTGRWHVVFDGPPAFQYTLLFTRRETGDETRILLEAPSGRYELLSTQDSTGRDSTESVRALGLDETLTRRLVLGLPAKAAGCPAVQGPDGCVVLEGPQGKLAAAFSSFSGEKSAEVRARAVVSPALAARIQAIAPLFASSIEFDAFGPDFLGLLWPEAFPERHGSPVKGRRDAGCAFDASFGRPCSEAEVRHEAARFPRVVPQKFKM